MPRTIVDIPPSQLRDLDALCTSLGISRAEGVRRALQDFLRQTESVDRAGFALWTSVPRDRSESRKDE